MMGIIELLILCLGAFGAIYGSKCIPETAVCSPYWVKMEPHKNLMESVEELNSWCRKQSLFFRCLEDVLLGKYGNYSELPTNMLVSKMFSADLCLEGSTSRKRYLDNAACINQLDTEYCTLPDYLEIVTPDSSVPPTKCSLAEKTFNCIAATMVMKCGFDAGRVYRYLLKVTKYGEDVCEVSSLDETCEEVLDTDKDKLSGIYYGLVHRFGDIPEQAMEAGSLDETESISISDGIISRAIKKVLDDLDNSSEIEASDETSTFSYHEVSRNNDEFRKKPVITEPFKGLLFYNYSDEVFEFYWRQPGSLPVDHVTCDNVFDSEIKSVMFECILHYGYEESECAKLQEEEELITPELIRDIDITIPDDSSLNISPSPDWTGGLRDYKRHRMSWSLFLNGKLVSDWDAMKKVNRELYLEYPSPNSCAKEVRFIDIINDHDVDWWQCQSLFSDKLRSEILTYLFQNRTTDTDFFYLTAYHANDTSGTCKTYIHIFEPLFHGFEKVVCERVNKCHPRGRGVIKCSFERRGIEGCDSCCGRWPVYARMCPSRRNQLKEIKNETESEAFLSEGGSGATDEPLKDTSTFMEKDETGDSSDESANFVTGVIDESGDLVAVDFSDVPDDSNADFSSDVHVMFLKRNSEDRSEDLYVANPEDAFISEEETVYDTLSEPEVRLLDNNIFIVQTMPSITDVGAAQ